MEGTSAQKIRVALAGNPNVGKSSLFNALTGLHHHTGNWSGKTVDMASGFLRGSHGTMEFVDLPGTYSLTGHSQEERIAAEYIAAGQADCTVVVCDGTALERNLILALQILQQAEKVVVCVNLVDEAERQGVEVDGEKLSRLLGAPVVLTAAARNQGINELVGQIKNCVAAPPQLHPCQGSPIMEAQRIAAQCVRQSENPQIWRLTLDKILVSRRRGVPIMLALLFLILWLTIWGANYPSQLLETCFDWGYGKLSLLTLPWWLKGVLLDGMYATATRVLAVMLPPMAIFFPLFTILEDVGYLPRMAFLLDGKMRRCGGCGKQALTLCMGLGCNAVGVLGCRIIDSPRQRLAAMLTNAMVPCNGRFATLIFLAGLFCTDGWAALAVAAAVVLGFLGAMLTTGALRKTALRREESVFLLELPPMRRPRVGQILVRSLLDRTLKIAARALLVAAPAGALIWILEQSGALGTLATFLQPLGLLLGLNGAILLAFFLSFPANELLLPLIAMIPGGNLQMGWAMAVCAMVFTVFHWPCSTTLLTIYQETKSAKKTGLAFLLPTAVGFLLCMLLNGIFQYFCG